MTINFWAPDNYACKLSFRSVSFPREMLPARSGNSIFSADRGSFGIVLVRISHHLIQPSAVIVPWKIINRNWKAHRIAQNGVAKKWLFRGTIKLTKQLIAQSLKLNRN